MKKSIFKFFTVLTIFSLVACGFSNGNGKDTAEKQSTFSEEIATNTPNSKTYKLKKFNGFIYDIGPRFNLIKKADLDTLKSFSDIIGDEHAQRIVTYKSLSVIILEGDEQSDIREIGNEGDFTVAQLELMQSVDYSTNLLIWADYMEKNVETGQVESGHWTPYLTVVPEKQARFISGKETLMDYLKNDSESVRTNVDADNLKPAKLYFTVTKNGTVENVYLDRSSGYPLVDEKMIELINKTQSAWIPAENTKGEQVDQELVVSFGTIGC